MHLTVVHPFTFQKKDAAGEIVSEQEYVRGSKIFDDDDIKIILSGDHARSVVRTANGQKPN